MWFGTAWYPEHWDRSAWESDLALMRDAGMNVVRVAEFAWSRLEPRDGVFEFRWLEEAIERAASYGMSVVIGTPSASPPAWLTAAHPDVLRVDDRGFRAIHGARGHFNPASATYIKYCRRVAEAMAIQFGKHPKVIGWQIDNEYWPFSYDADTRRQFQEFLRARYETLEQLNQRWTTAYWSQEYSEWSQIPLSIDWQNPCLFIEFRRFFTEIYRRYQAAQVDAIRPNADARQWITHNFHGWFQHPDPVIMCRNLDFASWDPYVGKGHLDPKEMGFRNDLVRGFKRRNFWVMETQPGFVQWAGVNNPLDSGEMRAMAWHMVGHGADAVLYWQWRPPIGGQEQYHGTIVNAGGRPRPIYPEVKQIGLEFARLKELLRDTEIRTDVAILWSNDDRWAIDYQKHHKDFSAMNHARVYYDALRSLAFEVDTIHPRSDLDGYRLILAPQAHLIDAALTQHLLKFAASGGHLLLGARSGVKNNDNALLTEQQPGSAFAEALGMHVEEYYALEGAVPVNGQGIEGEANTFAEWLTPTSPDAEVRLRYGEHSWLKGQAALVTRKIGKGRISYLGALLNDPLMRQVLTWAAQEVGSVPLLADLPDGVEVCRRVAEGRSFLILINHRNESREVQLPGPMWDVLNEVKTEPKLVLSPRAVAMLR